MSSLSGQKAESVAADYLTSLGYNIVDRNWRNERCEIDIIANLLKDEAILFEVKYRLNTSQGRGSEYINKRKLSQMRFAAENWMYENGWEGSIALGAIEVSGKDFQVTGFITEIY